MRTLLCLLLLAACNVPATKFTPGSMSGDDARNPVDSGGGSGGSGDAGMNQTPAMLSASPSGDVALGTVIIGQTSAESTITVSNDGDQASGMITLSLDDTTIGFAITDDNCSSMALDGHATCTFGLTFAPTASGAVQTNLSITANPGGTVMKVVSGTGIVQGQIDITDASYPFGSQGLGATQGTKTFTVRNNGQSQIGTPMPSISGDASYKVQATTCNAALGPTDTCTVTVQFAPTTVGSKAGSLVVSATPGGSDTATLSGTAFAHVAVTATGGGTVTSSPMGISCPGTCGYDFTSSPITLTAAPSATSSFSGWGGACSGTGNCSLALDGAKSVTATFAALAPPQIDITTASYAFGSQGLSATPGTTMFTVKNTGQLQSGTPMPSISGSDPSYTVKSTTCTAPLAPSGTCTVTVQFAPTTVGSKTDSLAVSASPGGSDTASLSGTAFAHVTVTTSGMGSGTITSNPTGISCPGTCAADFASSPVVLMESPSATASFAGWSGACSGTGGCSLTLNGDKSVTASFSALAPGAVDITVASYMFSNQDLGAAATEAFTVRNTGQLQIGTPIPSISGGDPSYTVKSTTCTAPLGPTDTCTVTVQFAPSSVGAKSDTLSVSASSGGSDTAALSGTAVAHVAVTVSGSGSITSSPAGISCPGTCAADFSTSPVTLMAAPGANQSFTGWSGDCSGTGNCSLALNGSKNVSASFSATSYAVSVSFTSGNTSGTNTITSSPAGINCNGSTGCSGMFTYGSMVTLTANPDADWGRFVSWTSGPCNGSTSPICSFTVSGTTTIAGSFTWYATMTILGNRGDNRTIPPTTDQTAPTQVIANDSSIACDTTPLTGTCTAHYKRGASIILTYSGTGSPNLWSTCYGGATTKTLRASASGSCTTLATGSLCGATSCPASEQCTASFTAPGDYTSQYNVYCYTAEVVQ